MLQIQPNLVWYSPLVHLTWRKVGYTINAAYVAGQISDPWQRSDENGAFYGEFGYKKCAGENGGHVARTHKVKADQQDISVCD